MHTQKNPNHHELLLLEPKTLFLVVVTAVVTLLVAFFGDTGLQLMTSVLSPVPEHAPFDGTVYPVKNVPNWVKLTETERKAAYSAIPKEKFIATPSYNPAHLAVETATLKWNDPKDDAVRNEKITYSVPYLGSYRLDGLEGSGSHPAVDIKVPEGTPVYSIANGTVTKTDNGNGGFGKHIVIQHNKVPSLADPQILTTYFASYSHMSNIIVSPLEVVTKGQLIGYSGSTGTATTPHIHFQIDTTDSAWHPYWPFTSADMSAAKLSFFEAINSGLKQSNAVAYTINPLKFVQAHIGEGGLVAAASTAFLTAQPVVDPYDSIVFSVQIPGATTVEAGKNIPLVIQAFDEKSNLIDRPTFQDEVTLTLLNANAILSANKITAAQLKTGLVSTIEVQNTLPGKNKVLVRFRNREFSSKEFEVVPALPLLQTLKITPAKLNALVGESIPVIVTALDAAGLPVVQNIRAEEAVILSLSTSNATLTQSRLGETSFVNGEALVSVLPSQLGSLTISALYKGQRFNSSEIIVVDPLAAVATPEVIATSTESVATSTEIIETVATTTSPIAEITPVTPVPPVEPTPPTVILAFSDVGPTSPYYVALSDLKLRGLVAGYSDGSFKPDAPVSRAEAITFILRAIDEQARNDFKSIFPDVSSDAWYAKFVATAYQLGFIKGYPDGSFRPEEKVNLAEFLTMLFVAAKTDVDPQIHMTLPEGVKAEDWFASYVQVALLKGILEAPNNSLDASRPLTRGEISVMLYKLVRLSGGLK